MNKRKEEIVQNAEEPVFAEMAEKPKKKMKLFLFLGLILFITILVILSVVFQKEMTHRDDVIEQEKASDLNEEENRESISELRQKWLKIEEFLNESKLPEEVLNPPSLDLDVNL